MLQTSRWLDPPVPQLKNTDGEDLLTTRIRFDVTGLAAVEKAFDSANELEREEGKTAWSWIGPNSQGKPTVLGRIVMQGESLELECDSFRRGDRGRAMIEKLAAGMARHRSTTHENVATQIRDELREGRGSEPEYLPRDVQEALALDYTARYYRNWLGEPVPALDGRTPREAAGDAALEADRSDPRARGYVPSRA